MTKKRINFHYSEEIQQIFNNIFFLYYYIIMNKYDNLPLDEAISKLRDLNKELKIQDKKLGRRNKCNENKKDEIKKKTKENKKNIQMYRDTKRQYKLFSSENLKNLPAKKIHKKMLNESKDLGITIK